MAVGAAEPDVKSSELALLFRLTSGLHAMDSGFGLSLFSRNQTLGDQDTNESFSVAGLGLWGDYKFETQRLGFANWLLWDMHYAVSGGTPELKLKSNYDLSLKLRKFFTSSFYTDFGVRNAHFQYESETVEYKSSKVFSHFGFGWVF